MITDKPRKKRPNNRGRMMSEREFREKLSRLQSLVATNNAMVMANPLKYLNEMNARCNKLLDILEKVEYALSPDMVFDFWDESCDKNQIRGPADINGEALIRCNAALEILRRYKGE